MKLLTLLFGVLYTARKERYMEPRPSLFSALSFRSVYSIQYSTVYRTVLYSIQYTEQYCMQYTGRHVCLLQCTSPVCVKIRSLKVIHF